jgi:glutamyl-tRNA synthetase
MLLYKYLGWEAPKMAHLPLIMSPSGGKLSKRKAETEGIAINSKDYREQRYEPEALVNFLAYLGWSPGDDTEIHSLDELVVLFTLDRVSKSGAVFNHKKLVWYNENYLREKPAEELYPRVQAIAEEQGISPDKEYLLEIIELMKDRVSKVEDFITQGMFFFEDPEEYEEKALKKWKDGSGEIVSAYLKKISDLDNGEFTVDNLKAAVNELTDEMDIGFGKVAMPLRVAVTGQGFGPDLFPAIELLGKETTVERIKTALDKLA